MDTAAISKDRGFEERALRNEQREKGVPRVRQVARAPGYGAVSGTAARPEAQLLRATLQLSARTPDAYRSGTSGEVQVEFTVGPDGSVSSARVVRADPPRVFDREAIAAVKRWRFQPVASAVTTRRTISFNPGQ